MATILGNAYVRVRPDTTGFGATLTAGLQNPLKQVAGLMGAITAVRVVGEVAKIGMAYEDSLNTLRAVSGATASEMDKVAETAKRLGSDTSLTATSAADAAVAMTELAKGGLTVNEAMGAARGTLQLAAAAGIDAAKASQLQSAALNAFNLEADQAGRVADVLANASNAAAGEMTDFGYALQAGGTVAAAAGISIENTAATLGILANNGILGSDAGTLLKSALLALQSPSDAAAAAMADLGLSAYDANGEFVGMESLFEQLQVASEGMTDQQYAQATSTLFGADAARLAGIAAVEGGEGFAQMSDAMGEQGSAAEVAAAKSQGLRGAIEGLMSGLETMAIEVYESVSPALEGFVRILANDVLPVISTVGGVIGTLVGWFADLPEPVLIGVAALTALMLINGPLAGAIGTSALALASWYGAAMTAATGAGIASTAMGFLRGAMSSTLALMGGPLGLAIVAVTVGLGFLVSAFGSSEDATEDNAAAQTELQQALMASKGAIDANVRAAAAKAAQDADLLNVAEQLGIPLSMVTDAILGQGTAYTDLMAAMRNARDMGLTFNGTQTELSLAADHGMTSLEALAGQTEGNIVVSEQLAAATVETGTAMGTLAEAVGTTEDALTEWRDNAVSILASFTEPLSIYTELVQEAATKTAESTESSSDSWSDYADSTRVNLGDYIDTLYEQLAAQEEWRHNIVEITGRGGQEIGDILFNMGAEGAGLVEQMVTANDEQFQLMKDGMIADARFAGEGAVRELQAQMIAMAIVGASGGQATVQGLAYQLGLGADVVRGIAAQYGLNLAEGVNPVLAAVGQAIVNVQGIVAGWGLSTRPYQTNRPTGFIGPTVPSANGNLFEPHQAEIATGGAIRVWAEPETGGEAYIPLAASKRARSLDIWKQTGKRLGVEGVDYFANGGFMMPEDVTRPPSVPHGFPLNTAASAVLGAAYERTKAWVAEQYAKHQAASEGGYNGAASPNGAGGLGPKAAAARAFVMGKWGITNIGGYANRNIAGTGTKSDHATGHAIDVMLTPDYNSKAKRSMGNEIAEYFRANPGQFGTKYVIYYDRIANGGAGWTPYGHPGGGRSDTLQHRDHVHVSVYDKGGLLEPGTTLVQNRSGKPEAVLTNEELENYKRLIANGGSNSGPLVGQLTIQVGSGADVRDGMEEAMFALRRIKRGGRP